MADMKKGGAIPISVLNGKRGSHGSPGEIDLSPLGIRDRYTIATGRGACIYDRKSKSFMSRSELSLSIGSKRYKDFEDDPETDRRPAHQIGFYPDRPDYIDDPYNTFDGLSIKPKKGDCSNILDLVSALCEENDAVTRWVTNWFAYILQNVGAKMQTAIVFHGPEGAGKNLFLGIFQKIFGDYFVIFTQRELQSEFNGWASRKLLGVGNEVVTHRNVYSIVGFIKNMITEPTWLINEKNINARVEANHTNFVFLSNELQPLAPGEGDRRLLVAWVRKKEKAFYRAVAQELENGGIEAFYYYLLNLDIGDFDEYTEPVMTQAKSELIDLSKKSDEKFLSRWLAEELPVPVIPCLTDDLYKYYQRWCKHEGEKFFVTMTEFGTRIGKCDDRLVKCRNQRYWDGNKKRKGTFVFHIDNEKPEGMTYEDWHTRCRSDFLKHVEDWVESSGA